MTPIPERRDNAHPGDRALRGPVQHHHLRRARHLPQQGAAQRRLPQSRRHGRRRPHRRRTRHARLRPRPHARHRHRLRPAARLRARLLPRSQCPVGTAVDPRSKTPPSSPFPSGSSNELYRLPKETPAFLNGIKAHNEKVWFDANRNRSTKPATSRLPAPSSKRWARSSRTIAPDVQYEPRSTAR